MYRICLLRILIKILHCDWFPVTGNTWRIFIIGCLQAHRRRRESETEKAWIIRVTIRGAILHFQNVCHFQNDCQNTHKIWAVKIQHFPISSTFDIWVDNDVPNWFPTLNNFYRSPFSKWPPQYRTNSTLYDFNDISYVGRLWWPELIPDIGKFQR